VAPNLPDLNPVDYSVRRVSEEEKVYKYELKKRLRTEWAKLDHVVIAAVISQWRH